MSDLVKHGEKTKFSEKQVGNSRGTDTATVDQNDVVTAEGASSRVVESASSQNARTVQTSSNKERVNIGFNVSFTVPFRSFTPTPSKGNSC